MKPPHTSDVVGTWTVGLVFLLILAEAHAVIGKQELVSTENREAEAPA